MYSLSNSYHKQLSNFEKSQIGFAFYKGGTIFLFNIYAWPEVVSKIAV